MCGNAGKSAQCKTDALPELCLITLKKQKIDQVTERSVSKQQDVVCTDVEHNTYIICC